MEECQLQQPFGRWESLLFPQNGPWAEIIAATFSVWCYWGKFKGQAQ